MPRLIYLRNQMERAAALVKSGIVVFFDSPHLGNILSGLSELMREHLGPFPPPFFSFFLGILIAKRQSMTSLPVTRDTHRRPHGPRSKNGCLTCKRRKVRCNELRPRCYHCQRLNLDCVWKDTGLHRQGPLQDVEARDPFSSNIPCLEVNKVPPPSHFLDFRQSVSVPTASFPLFQNFYSPDFGDFTASSHTFYERAPSADENSQHSSIARQSPPQSPVAKMNVESSLKLHLPPILDPVENGPRCASARELLESMATSSPMLRSSIAAFEAIQSGSAGGNIEYQKHYDNAATELSHKFDEHMGQSIVNNELRYVLSTIFFLTYINVGSADVALIVLSLSFHLG